MTCVISDLLDSYPAEAVDLEQNTPLSGERIREMTMKQIIQKPKKRLGTRLLLAAAIIVLLIMSVFAAEDIATYDNWLEDFFSGKEVVAELSENQLALLDQTIAELNQSVTSNGYTVTLERAVTDGYVAYLTFRIDAPEGQVLEGFRYSFDEIPFELLGTSTSDGEVTVSTAGWTMLDDADKTDNSVRLLLKYSTSDANAWKDSLTNGEEKTVTINTFKEQMLEEPWEKTVAEGEWTFTFSFEGTGLLTQEVEMLPSPVRCNGRRLLIQEQFDVSVKVTSFRLRGLTATLTYEEPLTGTWHGITLGEITVVLRDGSRVTARYRTGSGGEGYGVCTYEFDVPISFPDVDYIEFAGGDRAHMPDIVQ